MSSPELNRISDKPNTRTVHYKKNTRNTKKRDKHDNDHENMYNCDFLPTDYLILRTGTSSCEMVSF